MESTSPLQNFQHTKIKTARFSMYASVLERGSSSSSNLEQDKKGEKFWS